MKDELQKEKIKRAMLAITDLLESGVYDYYYGEELKKTQNFFWDNYDLKSLLDKLEQFINQQ